MKKRLQKKFNKFLNIGWGRTNFNTLRYLSRIYYVNLDMASKYYREIYKVTKECKPFIGEE